MKNDLSKAKATPFNSPGISVWDIPTTPIGDLNLKEYYKEYTHTKMTFGKYKGHWISEIPDEYLKWGIKKLDSYIGTMFAVELQRRHPEFR
jgi:uncharacterized protein (DUF3820 family)